MSAIRKTDAIGSGSDFDDIKLTDKQYTKFAEYMYELAGVDLPLSTKNHALVRNRMIKLLRRHELRTYEDYWQLLTTGSNPALVSEFISALTTNMTSFYREPTHFDFLREVLPQFMQKKNELRIWCAAASTGQEPYTIAMVVKETLGDKAASAKMLSTDIDLQVLKKAANGRYEEREMQGLPPTQRPKYFTKVKGPDAEYWRVKDDIHALIRFAPFNLMNPKYEFQHKFDIIFCRNVLIYFDEETTRRVIANLAACLAPGGYLILGHSESGNVKNSLLKPLSRAVYQKIGQEG